MLEQIADVVLGLILYPIFEFAFKVVRNAWRKVRA